MFAEVPFLDRPAAAARAGFDAVECHYPYDIPPEEFRRALAEAGVPLLGINTAVKRLGPGDTGVGAVIGQEAEARHRFEEALDYVRAAGGSAIHVKPGDADAESFAAEACFVAHLKDCAARAAPHGITILIEPLSGADSAGYFLRSNAQAAEILRMVGDPDVRLMFDLYHMGVDGADILSQFDRYRSLVGHVQFAGLAGRGEPSDSGEPHCARAPSKGLSCLHLLAALHRRGYSGWMAAEYRPRGATSEGLGWMARLKAMCAATA
jgi:hydroxypyruvate isomerase